MLHLTNGDSVVQSLRAAHLPGAVTAIADLLHEGPCPTAADPTDFRELRARYLADAGYAPYAGALERFVEADAVLHGAGSHDEVVLWFEHDLYDQLLLVRLLAWFGLRPSRATPLSLICIGSYPGFARFDGLGQLNSGQLAELFPGRVGVTAAQTALAMVAWASFGEEDPLGFAALLERDTGALPYLAAAVKRQLQELPWTRDGLSRAERQALVAVAAGAPDLTRAFVATQAMEEAVFMGDTPFFRMVRSLAQAARPLVELDPPGEDVPAGRQRVALTAFGREVLAGHADYARANGVDRWIGGVHLHGHEPAWRWDEERGVVGRN